MSRRAFASVLAAAGGRSALARNRKRILILGGTGFLGPAIVRAALARGHELTLFNRGKTRPGMFPNVEALLGDRDPLKGEGLKAIERGQWDVVIDNTAYFPRHVTASAKLLASRVKQYILTSSISVYADNSMEGQDETARLATTPDPSVEKITEETYGPLKALCEKACQDVFPGRATIVRPGYIVGPDDPTGRFTYWPVRIDRGGEVLVPGAPNDPIQFIDVRDLGEWVVLLAENFTTGVFNAVGPKDRFAWGTLIETCRKATRTQGTLTWVPGDWIAKQSPDVFPLWAPYSPTTRGFHTWKNTRAVTAGLKFRPCVYTVTDTLSWYRAQGESGRKKLAGPTPEKEASKEPKESKES